MVQRRLALQVLGGIDENDSTHELGIALADADPDVRHAALIALLGQQSPAVTELLVRAVQDPLEPIRSLALEMLSQRGRAGQSGVARALTDPDPAISARARQVLEQIRSEPR